MDFRLLLPVYASAIYPTPRVEDFFISITRGCTPGYKYSILTG
jgi:hypothetical protein